MMPKLIQFEDLNVPRICGSRRFGARRPEVSKRNRTGLSLRPRLTLTWKRAKMGIQRAGGIYDMPVWTVNFCFQMNDFLDTIVTCH